MNIFKALKDLSNLKEEVIKLKEEVTKLKEKVQFLESDEERKKEEKTLINEWLNGSE